MDKTGEEGDLLGAVFSGFGRETSPFIPFENALGGGEEMGIADVGEELFENEGIGCHDGCSLKRETVGGEVLFYDRQVSVIDLEAEA